jgi:hypothetical protein
MTRHNLTTKKISEFTGEDTIYIPDTSDDRKPQYLCQFISFDRKNMTVTGKIIAVEKGVSSDRMLGTQLTASLYKCGLYGKSVENETLNFFRRFDASLYAMHPLEEVKVVENDLHVAKHPSYGLIGLSRRSSSHGVPLFGSSIQNTQTITLQIKRAEHSRNYGGDHYFGQENLIEVELSQTQFAEMITTMNVGDGVPCTIRYINIERYPDPPFQSKMDIFHGEFKKVMHNYSVDIKKVAEEAIEILKNKPSIGKADREKILQGVESLLSKISSGIPFMTTQFEESMEKSVTEAKAHIEAFVENKIRTTGLEALGFKAEEHTPKLDNIRHDGEAS